MDVKIKTVFLHAEQQLSKARVSGKLCSQHMRMQQKADDRLQFRTIPIGERDAQEDVVLSCVAIKQDVQGRRKNREQADLLLAAAFAQGLRERSRDLEAPLCAPVGIDGGRGRSVGSSSSAGRRASSPPSTRGPRKTRRGATGPAAKPRSRHAESAGRAAPETDRASPPGTGPTDPATNCPSTPSRK